MRNIRLLIANALCRLASFIAGNGVEADTWVHTPLPPKGHELYGATHKTVGSVWLAYR
jgi:hypothetical protein